MEVPARVSIAESLYFQREVDAVDGGDDDGDVEWSWWL